MERRHPWWLCITTWVCVAGMLLASVPGCGLFGSSCEDGRRSGNGNGPCSDSSHFRVCEGGEGSESNYVRACETNTLCITSPDAQSHACKSQDQLDCVTELPGATGTGLRVADLNGDGLSDLVYLVNGTLFVSFGSPAGDFLTDIPLVQTCAEFRLEQLNADQRVDLVVLDRSGQVSVRFGRGDGFFGVARALGNALHLLGAGDLDNDGVADLIVAPEPGRLLWLSSKQDLAPVEFGIALSAPATEAVPSLASDGVAQLVLSDESLQTSSFTLSADRWSLKQMMTGKLLTAADVDQDGRIDLVLTVGDSTHVELGSGDGRYELSANSFGTALLAADLNADGLLDLEIQRSDGLYPLRGLGDGTFAEGAPLHLVDRFENLALVKTVRGSELLYGTTLWSVVSAACLAR